MNFDHSQTIEISPARWPNFARSSGPHTVSHAPLPIRLRTHCSAVTCSYGVLSLPNFWTARTDAPIRTRPIGDSGLKRSRSIGLVNGHCLPSMKNDCVESRHSSSSGIPSSS